MRSQKKSPVMLQTEINVNEFLNNDVCIRTKKDTAKPLETVYKKNGFNYKKVYCHPGQQLVQKKTAFDGWDKGQKTNKLHFSKGRSCGRAKRLAVIHRDWGTNNNPEEECCNEFDACYWGYDINGNSRIKNNTISNEECEIDFRLCMKRQGSFVGQAFSNIKDSHKYYDSSNTECKGPNYLVTLIFQN